ncbi:NAD(P)-binding protein [Daedalea quercina L-15889]|uniref:NAD(P)-binding protein n=1 Tax=Daedalea quercina L-15889 TaxID=1314783 RepID=A0A165KP33_9APHY|nr:NAD(P)-binding protein [Daedalea quercina L-15889]
MSTVTTWLVTGASRGLGCELVRQLVAAPDNFVVAAVRNPDSASQLHALRPAQGSALHVVQLDVSSEESIRASVPEVEAILSGRGLDYLYNNAGMSAQDDGFNFSYEQLLAALQTNVAAPALLGAVYLPLLDKGSKKTIVNVSSGMGSLTQEHGSAMTTYCVSKAAVNMLTYKQVRTRPEIVAISLSPGWVKTDMGGSDAPLEPPESVAGQLKVVRGLRKKDAGKFLSYDGKELTW